MERANRHNSKRQKVGKKELILKKHSKKISSSYQGERVNNEFLEDKWDQ